MTTSSSMRVKPQRDAASRRALSEEDWVEAWSIH